MANPPNQTVARSSTNPLIDGTAADKSPNAAAATDKKSTTAASTEKKLVAGAEKRPAVQAEVAAAEAASNTSEKKNTADVASPSRIVAAPDTKGGGSIFSQLSNKIRQLERNMTLSSRFLEQMRSRYIKLNLSLTQGFNSTNIEFRRVETLIQSHLNTPNTTDDQAILMEAMVEFMARQLQI